MASYFLQPLTENYTRKNTCKAISTKLFEEFLFLVLQVCNYVNNNFFSLETVSYVKNSRGFFQHF